MVNRPKDIKGENNMFKFMRQMLCFVLILGLAFSGVLGLVPKPTYALAAHPYISEVVDAGKAYKSGYYHRYVEIYNPTNGDIDLSNYKVGIIENGKDPKEVELTGTLASGQTVVVGQSDHDYVTISDGRAKWNSFNGKTDDGAILKFGDDVIDTMLGMSFENGKAVRNRNIAAPSASFNADEWTSTKIQLLTEATPGSHDSQYPESTTKVAKVVITPESGKTFDFSVESGTITLSSTTEGAEIKYGIVNHPTDKTAPDSFETYTGPITITEACDIYAYASKDGMENSDTEKVTYYSLATAKIQDVRTEKGRLVRVEGIATARVGSNSIYIQDDTAGIILSEYKSGHLDVNVGDKVEVIGKISEFYGNSQIQPASSSDVKVIQAAAGVPAAKVITADQATESVEGQLVTIKNVALAAKDSKGNVVLTDSTGSMKMYYQGAFYAEENHESITGVINYHYNEYKIIPRGVEDFVQDSSKTERPSANLPSGNVESGTQVTLTSRTSDAKIYYAIGADEASVTLNYGEGTEYTGPITINDENKYIKAYAKNDSLDNSVMISLSYVMADVTHINEIQGASHTSPLEGQEVAGVKGIVTAVSKDKYLPGFYMQEPDATKDSDPKTSEGIFVSTTLKVSSGDLVSVNGTVTEKKNDTWDGTLKETIIVASAVTKVASGYDLPEAIILGKNGRPVITQIVDNDSFGTFDPEQDAIDYYEAVEGMLVKIESPAIVGGDERYGEIYVLADNGEASADKRSYRGGIILTENSVNPEIMTIDDVLVPLSSNKVFKDKNFTPNPGDTFSGDITGVVGYGFGKYKIYNIAALPTVIDNAIASQKPVTTVVGDEDTVTVASFNVENFSKDKGIEKADAIANAVVTNMRTPDIIALIEVQDNDGETKSDVVDGSESYQFLIDRIKLASGNTITYAFTEIAPMSNLEGGVPGGNIRVGYLYNPDRVSLAAGEKGAANEAVTMLDNGHLSKNPGRVDPMNEAFASTRRSLVAEFEFNGESLFVITNHLSSKRGDAPVFGDTQPVVRKSEVNRHKQAQVINDFVDSMMAKNPDASVVVLGDMNDFHFSETLKVIAGKDAEQVLINPVSLLPLNKQFTYNYGGSSQVLDNILVTENIDYTLEALSINAGFYHSQGRASDHDPVILGVTFSSAKPSITVAEARAKNIDEEVTIKAVVQNTPGIFGQKSFAVSDDTGSIFAFTNNDYSLKMGDRVAITGTIAEYKNLRQIKPTSVKVLANNVALTPKEVKTVGEGEEASLVKMSSAFVKSMVESASFNNAEIVLTVDGQDIKAKLDSRTGANFEAFKAKVTTGAHVQVTGIVLQSEDDYIVNLRSLDDISDYVIPVSSLHEVRNMPVGSKVVTEGVVVNVPGAFGGKSFAINSGFTGIYIYTSKDLPSDLTLGTKIRITATTKEFNGLKQLDFTNIEVLSQNNRISYRGIDQASELAEMESQLVRIESVLVKSVETDQHKNTKFVVTYNGDDISCKLDARSGDNYDAVKSKLIVGETINIQGLVSNYKGNYTLKLRDKNDIMPEYYSNIGAINVTDIAGNVMTSISKNDMIFVDAALSATTDVHCGGLLFIKITDKNNKMVRVGMVRNAKTYSESTALGFDLSGLAKGDYTIKAFFWDSWDQKMDHAKPVEKVITIQ